MTTTCLTKALCIFVSQWHNEPNNLLSTIVIAPVSKKRTLKLQEGIFVNGDASIALYTLLSSVRWVYDWYKPGRSLDAQAVSEAVAKIILQGLGTK